MIPKIIHQRIPKFFKHLQPGKRCDGENRFTKNFNRLPLWWGIC